MRRTGGIWLTTLLAVLPGQCASSALPDYPLDARGLETRADYYTKGGKYLGGIPTHSDASALYNCTELNFDLAYNATVGHDTACISWTENVAGSSEQEFGRCSCQSVMNVEYCDAWTCSDLAISNSGDQSPCPSDVDASVATSCPTETVVHSTRCVCEIEDDSGNFCASWMCLESDYQYGGEFGEFKCVRVSPAADYCDAWTGVVETSDHAEVSVCACTQESDDSRVCLQWACEMRSMTKCSNASPGWCDLGFSIGIGGFIGSFGALLVALGLLRRMKKSESVSRCSPGLFVFVGFAWMAMWSIGVVIWGGVDGALCAALWWGAFIVIGLLRGCFYKLFA